jgi:hypothetical protein
MHVLLLSTDIVKGCFIISESHFLSYWWLRITKNVRWPQKIHQRTACGPRLKNSWHNKLPYLITSYSLIFRSTNQIHHIQSAAHCLSCIKLPETINQYIFALKMASAVSAEMFYNSTLDAACSWKPKFTLNSRCEKLRASIAMFVRCLSLIPSHVFAPLSCWQYWW